jgi:hypothetical protein
MSDDFEAPEQGKRRSEAVFFSVVALVMLAVFAGAAYFLGAFDSSNTKTPAASPHSSAPSSPQANKARASRAAAVAVVEKNFRLALDGKYRAACALESPTYLKFDASNYSHGGCAGNLRADILALHSHGLSMKLTSTKVESFADGQATVLAKATVGSKATAQHIYLQFHGTKWWITGADDSGDVGY